MDTPSRNDQQQEMQPGAQQQSGTPNSVQGQDSPFYRFLENLSPIQTFQPVHYVHSLSFPSVNSPVFKTPRFIVKKETKPINSYPLPDLTKSESPCKDEDEKKGHVGDKNIIKITDHPCDMQVDDLMNILNEDVILSPDKSSDQPTKDAESFQHNSCSPNHRNSLSNARESDIVMARKSTMEVAHVLEGHDGSLHEPELGDAKENKKLREIDTWGWMDLLCNADIGVLFRDSSDNRQHDPGCTSLSSGKCQCTRDNATPTDEYFGVCHQNASQELFEEDNREFTDGKQAVCTSHILSILEDKLMNGEPIEKLVAGSDNNFDTSGSEIAIQQQLVTRRRCLTYEIAGAHKMGSVGLHLNTHAQDQLPSKVPTNVPFPLSSSPSLPREEKSAQSPFSAKRDNPELKTHGTPKNKKRRTGKSGNGDFCGRCNCKKSKCLKLYCECFAAGVYCVGQCSCQGCLNKSDQEDKITQTRKQIESRNPLAFAPKVVTTSEHPLDTADDARKTPAPARHRRGCNCKKSSCLKKYCECYQVGVGCSASCRCEACKNTFGRRDGTMREGEEAASDQKGLKKPKTEKTTDARDDKQATSECIPRTPSSSTLPS